MIYLQEVGGRMVKSWSKRIHLLAFIILLVGCIGYFLLPRGPLIFYIFAHLGALGLLGLIGATVGTIARKKGRSYSTAFLLGSLFPIAAGIIAVIITAPPISCGGSVSLAVAFLIILFYSFINKKKLPETEHAG